MDTMLSDIDAASVSMPAYPSRRHIHAEMMKFAVSDTRAGLTMLTIDVTLYIAAIAGVLFLDPTWAKILCSVLIAFKISNFLAIAHDASHGSFVRGPKANKFIAILTLAPCLFNYRLWLYDHHVLHHRNVNGKHRDSFTPFSKAEFDALPRYRQLRERFYRMPYGLGFGVYEIFERWLAVKLMPRSFMPDKVRAEALPHFIFLMGYLAVYLAVLAAAPLYSHTSTVTAVGLGFVLPYALWMIMLGFTVFIQHTHTRIAWFEGSVDRTTVAPPELVSTHIEFPHWLKALMHNVYDHAAHHVQPRIPCYRLTEAQARLNEIMGPYSIKTDFSWAWLFDTIQRCKLYDFENRRWLDFEGRPTTETVALVSGNRLSSTAVDETPAYSRLSA